MHKMNLQQLDLVYVLVRIEQLMVEYYDWTSTIMYFIIRK